MLPNAVSTAATPTSQSSHSVHQRSTGSGQLAELTLEEMSTRSTAPQDLKQQQQQQPSDPKIITSSSSRSLLSQHSDEQVQQDSELVEASDPELFQAGVKEHAVVLGIDLDQDADLLWIARESLVAPLPEGYSLHTTADGRPYYYNATTGESQWDHPCDEEFRQLYQEMKAKKFHTEAATTASTCDDSGNGMAFSSSGSSSTATTSLSSPDTSTHQPPQLYPVHSWHSSFSYYPDTSSPTDAVAAAAAVGATSTSYPDYEYQHHHQAIQNGWMNAAATTASSAYPQQQQQQDYPSYNQTTYRQEGYPTYREGMEYHERTPAPSLASTPRHPTQELELHLKQEIIEELRLEVKKLTRRLERQKEDLQQLENDKTMHEETFNDLKLRLEFATKKNETLAEANQVLKKELLVARNAVEDTNGINDQVTTLEAKLAQETLSKDEAVKKNNQLQRECKRQQDELSETRSLVDQLESKLFSLNNSTSESSQLVMTLQSQLDAKTKQCVDLQESGRQLQATILLLQQAQDVTAASAASAALERQQERDRDKANEAQFQLAHQLEIQVDDLQRQLQGLQQRLESKQQELDHVTQNATTRLTEYEESLRTCKHDQRALERDLKLVQSALKDKDMECSKHLRTVTDMEQSLQQQEQLLDQARASGYAQAQQESEAMIKHLTSEKSRLSELYTQELHQRRKLHNKLMELQGNIRVFCRVRPIQPVELKATDPSSGQQAVLFRDNDAQMMELVVAGANMNTNDLNSLVGAQRYSFEFDHVFQPQSSQVEVFEQTKALVMSALDGFNVCIFAYGQTGSGKTFTMEGPESDRGVNFRSLAELFHLRDERVASGSTECVMKLSMLEVYNETIVDLLEGNSHERRVLDVRVGKNGVYVENLIEVEVTNEKDVHDLMKLGHSHRSVGAHDINEHSSRSHLVLSITIETWNKQQQSSQRTISKLHLIDLAGSERVSKTAASGQRLKEAQNINRSLSALGDVIAALGSNSKHVPYRNSKLTFLLQDSLSGNSKVLMFVNVSPVQWNAWETLCSLNFAARCRSVALGQAKANVATALPASSLSSSSSSTASSGSSNVSNSTNAIRLGSLNAGSSSSTSSLSLSSSSSSSSSISNKTTAMKQQQQQRTAANHSSSTINTPPRTAPSSNGWVSGREEK